MEEEYINITEGIKNGAKNIKFIGNVKYNGEEINIQDIIPGKGEKNLSVWVLSLGAVIGGALLDTWIGLEFTITISQKIFALASEVATTLNKKK